MASEQKKRKTWVPFGTIFVFLLIVAPILIALWSFQAELYEWLQAQWGTIDGGDVAF